MKRASLHVMQMVRPHHIRCAKPQFHKGHEALERDAYEIGYSKMLSAEMTICHLSRTRADIVF